MFASEHFRDPLQYYPGENEPLHPEAFKWYGSTKSDRNIKDGWRSCLDA